MPGERAQVVERAPTSPMSRARAKLLACLIGGSDKKRWFLCGYWPTLGETFPDRSEVMPNLLGGLVGGLNCILCLAVMASIYFSPFNFVSGEAASEATSLGMTMLLFTSSISIVVSALFGRLQYAIVASQDVPAVLLALTVPRIIAHTMGDDDGIIGDDEHGVMSEEDKARKALLSTPRTCLTSSPFSPSLGLGVRGRDACLPRHLVGRLLYRLLLLLRRSNEAGHARQAAARLPSSLGCSPPSASSPSAAAWRTPAAYPFSTSGPSIGCRASSRRAPRSAPP